MRGRWVRERADWRQLGLIGLYLSLLFGMYFVPILRHPVCWGAACYLSFVNAIVIHNHLHQGIFVRQDLNDLFKLVLSFGNLYPASANTPSHNLVHHHYHDDGRPDWASPACVSFGWNLLNLIHFPNVAGPRTFAGVQRWAAVYGRDRFRRQYLWETAFAFGLTSILAFFDFWTTLFFIVLPQLWGARGILRINLIQHDGCDLSSRFNHSRNFVGRWFNWVTCNNGYHTIHHNRAGLHWSSLPEAHHRDVRPHMDASLEEPSMLSYLLRTYLFRISRPEPIDVASAERSRSPGPHRPASPSEALST
ncbi:MAG: fatty acid desaturase family protein [Myxococcota bacterium]